MAKITVVLKIKDPLNQRITIKKIATAGTALVWILLGVSCASRPPEENLVYGQKRFEEQMKGYPDRDSRAQEKAREAEAAKDSMLTGRVK